MSKNDADASWLKKQFLLHCTNLERCKSRVKALWDALNLDDVGDDLEFWSQHSCFDQAVKELCEERFVKSSDFVSHDVISSAFLVLRFCSEKTRRAILNDMIHFAIQDVYGGSPRLLDDAGNLEKIALHLHDAYTFCNAKASGTDPGPLALTKLLETCIETAAAAGRFSADADYKDFFTQPLPALLITLGADADAALQAVTSGATFEIGDARDAVEQAQKRLQQNTSILAAAKTLTAVRGKTAGDVENKSGPKMS